MVRSTGKTGPGVQPPAAEAHVDFTTRRPPTTSPPRSTRGRARTGRAMTASSLSASGARSPAAAKLAAGAVRRLERRRRGGHAQHQGRRRRDPQGRRSLAQIPGEEDMIAATIFHHNPAHRWYYFPDMDARRDRLHQVPRQRPQPRLARAAHRIPRHQPARRDHPRKLRISRRRLFQQELNDPSFQRKLNLIAFDVQEMRFQLSLE